MGGLLAIPGCASFTGGANDRMNMAAIGCGRRGRGNIRNMISTGAEFNVQFVAVCDVDEKRARETKTFIEEIYAEEGYEVDIRVYTDPDRLLRKRSIDGVVISLPDHQHAAVAIAAANAGKDIYLEKPLTFTIREGQDLVKAVRNNRVILQTGTQQRSSLYFRRVCELARNGILGDLKAIEVRLPKDLGYGEPAPMPVPDNLDYRAWQGDAPLRPYTEDRVHPQEGYGRPGWMQVEDYCHGMITNWGAHMLDIAQWGNGTDYGGPTRIKAWSTYEDRGLWNVHTTISSECTYGNGVELRVITLDEGEDKVNRQGSGVKFIGTKAWARTQRGAFEASDRELLRWEPGPNDIQLVVSNNEYRNFYEAMRDRTDPCSPVEIGHRSNSLCVLHQISAKLGREIHWDPSTERAIGDPMANRMLEDMRLLDHI